MADSIQEIAENLVERIQLVRELVEQPLWYPARLANNDATAVAMKLPFGGEVRTAAMKDLGDLSVAIARKESARAASFVGKLEQLIANADWDDLEATGKLLRLPLAPFRSGEDGEAVRSGVLIGALATTALVALLIFVGFKVFR